MSLGLFERAQAAAAAIRRAAGTDEPAPTIGLVLGSGLAEVAGRAAPRVALPYGDIPHFAGTRVAGHPGTWLVGRLGGVPVHVLAGRVHAYEGFAPAEVGFGVRVLAALGCRLLVQTNAAGGVDRRLPAGSLMAIDDHINLTGLNPLVGADDPRLGPRFLDMTFAYDARLVAAWHAAARAAEVELFAGTYAGVVGPNYETPAEVRYLAGVGAQAVGMSTVLETLVARHAGLGVAGLSVITNAAAGHTAEALSHAEVTETGRSAAQRVALLLEHFLPRAARAVVDGAPG